MSKTKVSIEFTVSEYTKTTKFIGFTASTRLLKVNVADFRHSKGEANLGYNASNQRILDCLECSTPKNGE